MELIHVIQNQIEKIQKSEIKTMELYGLWSCRGYSAISMTCFPAFVATTQPPTSRLPPNINHDTKARSDFWRRPRLIVACSLSVALQNPIPCIRTRCITLFTRPRIPASALLGRPGRHRIGFGTSSLAEILR